MRKVIVLLALLPAACATDYSSFARPPFEPTYTTLMDRVERRPFDGIIGSTVILSVNKEWRDGNTLYRRTAAGCGVALGRGRLLTAYHVIRDATEIWGQAWSVDADGTAAPASPPVLLSVKRTAENKDVAILSFDEDELRVSPARAAGRAAQRGDEVWLMGCARGWAGGRVTDTAADTPPVGRLTELQIRSGPGNSGAPVVDAAGDVLGINIAGSQSRGVALYVTLKDALDSLGR